MPQSFHVLRCYKCETFQVHIIKKSNKWECKICGDKQSLKQKFGEGSAKECRLHVQKLNEMRAYTDANRTTLHVEEVVLQHTSGVREEESKWNKYIKTNSEKPSSSDGNDIESDGVEYVLEMPSRKRKVSNQYNNKKFKGKQWKKDTHNKISENTDDFIEGTSESNGNTGSIFKISNQVKSDCDMSYYDCSDEDNILQAGVRENLETNSHTKSNTIVTNQQKTIPFKTIPNENRSVKEKQQNNIFSQPSMMNSKWSKYLEPSDVIADNNDDAEDDQDLQMINFDHSFSDECQNNLPLEKQISITNKLSVDTFKQKNNSPNSHNSVNRIFESCDDSNLDDVFNL